MKYDVTYYKKLLKKSKDVQSGVSWLINRAMNLESDCKLYKSAYYDRTEAYLELQNKAEKQEKIIDLMAEDLKTPIHSKEWIKQEYEKRYIKCTKLIIEK